MNDDFDVEKVAKLALLKLTDEEKKQFAKELPLILDYVGKLAEVDTSKVEVKEYLIEQSNVFRADDVRACDAETAKAAIDSFPKKKGNALQVPEVFE